MRKPNSIIVLLRIQNKETKNNTNEVHEHFMPAKFIQHFLFNVYLMQQCIDCKTIIVISDFKQ